MKSDIEKAPIVLRRTPRGLEPTNRLARELLDKYALHTDVEVTIKKRRSNPQNNLYWAILSRVVEATEAYPTSDHLHDALKMALGFTRPLKLLSGEIVWQPDSTAFAKMDAVQFREYFDRAMAKLAELTGTDPLVLVKEAA